MLFRFTTIAFCLAALAFNIFAQTSAVPKKTNERPAAAPASEPFDKADVKMMAGQCVKFDTDAGAIEMERS